MMAAAWQHPPTCRTEGRRARTAGDGDPLLRRQLLRHDRRPGETHPFWEFNLRFKTDSSERDRSRAMPSCMPAGMMGDRASVIFADPEEISAFIEKRC